MSIWVWIFFLVFIICLLAIDLGVFHRKAHSVSVREALCWTCVWVTLSLLFNFLLFYMYREHWFGIGLHSGGESTAHEAALKFFTGYLVEYSLSMDNIFVIALICGYFAIPKASQHTVLFWGILGAIVLRGTMILLGTALVIKFTWIFYVFGILLIFSAVKMLFMDSDNPEPDKNPVMKLARKFYPVTQEFRGNRFFIIKNGKKAMTPLFLALIVIETTDLVFAIDSIPAIFAITTDPFIVFSSNIFAILGLRSLYFVLSGMMDKFAYLKYSLVMLLAFVGVKMLLHKLIHIPALFSLGIILTILLAGIFFSVRKNQKLDPAVAE